MYGTQVYAMRQKLKEWWDSAVSQAHMARGNWVPLHRVSGRGPIIDAGKALSTDRLLQDKAEVLSVRIIWDGSFEPSLYPLPVNRPSACDSRCRCGSVYMEASPSIYTWCIYFWSLLRIFTRNRQRRVKPKYPITQTAPKTIISSNPSMIYLLL